MDPRREIEAVVDPVDRPQNLEEGLLGEVLGELPVAQEPESQAINGLVVALEEGVEGGHVAAEIIANKIEVRGSLGNSCHYPLYRLDSAKSVSTRSPPAESRGES